MPTDDELAWHADAECLNQGVEPFFSTAPRETSRALQTCGRCTVRVECLAYALAHNEQFGIWGGRTERELAQIRRDLQRRTETP